MSGSGGNIKPCWKYIEAAALHKSSCQDHDNCGKAKFEGDHVQKQNKMPANSPFFLPPYRGNNQRERAFIFKAL